MRVDVKKKTAVQIKVSGLVQGVGFRPFVYKLSKKHALNGWVRNTNHNVEIRVEGVGMSIERFLKALNKEKPAAASIMNIEVNTIDTENLENFLIKESESLDNRITRVSPDIAVCDECMEDIQIQSHRIKYPFINCTHCGPRFTIIRSLPYDRNDTTMDVFSMCPQCAEEYTNILDRRFHAQPVACNTCGPELSLTDDKGEISELDPLLKQVCEALDNGKVIALKGLGGFHLACNANDSKAVERLRNIKKRDKKPFAVMCKDVESVKKYAFLNETEEKELISWRRPIVILESRNKLPEGISSGFSSVGCMLPYMPVHYLLFDKLQSDALVLTSGNLSEEPITIDNREAELLFGNKVDIVVTYNRAIQNRTDDSVCYMAGDEMRVLRRSRGYVPAPIDLGLKAEGIMATGAELVNCFCIGKGQQAILSQHIGDLKNFETWEFYKESYDRFKELFRFQPDVVACDLHPDYLSTRFASETGLKTLGIQHHHAHIASVMAEHQLDEEVIGLSLDGTGYGTDGAIWGGELLICDLVCFDRVNHFKYLPMPGGEMAVLHPWRMAASYLNDSFGEDWASLDIPFIHDLKKKDYEFELFKSFLTGNSHIQTSSAGRLFDSVAALLNVCTESGFHAEAPMRLEDIIQPGCEEFYTFDYQPVMSFESTIREIVSDITRKKEISAISAKFHNTLVEVLIQSVISARKEKGHDKVVLSGGSFQNKYLLEKLSQKLNALDFNVYTGMQIPVNDGGLALGQLAVAAKQIETGIFKI